MKFLRIYGLRKDDIKYFFSQHEENLKAAQTKLNKQFKEEGKYIQKAPTHRYYGPDANKKEYEQKKEEYYNDMLNENYKKLKGLKDTDEKKYLLEISKIRRQAAVKANREVVGTSSSSSSSSSVRNSMKIGRRVNR